MLFTRKLGKIMRGKATTSQILLACILGSILGFLPGLTRAPGLTVFIIILLIVLNANIGLALSLFAFSKTLYYLSIPLVFKTGVFLLEGFTQKIFTYLINAPVFALFGFEYYLTTGGFLWGIIVGSVTGIFLSIFIKKFRKSMVNSDSSPDKINFLNSKPGKALIFVLFGKGEKEDYKKALEKKSFPIRISGLILALIVFAILFGAQRYLAGTAIKKFLKTGLEEANGATVDIGKAYINLKEGKFVMENLAICDPEKPEQNLFEAKKIVADISALNLLSKRLKFDEVTIKGGEIGSKRKKPGKVFRPINVEVSENPGKNSLEYYIANAKEIKIKLKKIKYWYKTISKQKKYTDFLSDKETWEDKLEREAKALGYQNIKAKHLIRKNPTLVIAKFNADKVKTYGLLKQESLDIDMKNISTNPELIASPPEINIVSSEKTFVFHSKLGQLCSQNKTSRFEISLNKMNAEKVLKSIKLKTENTIKGGTITIKWKGEILDKSDIELNSQMNIYLENSTMTIPKLGKEKISKLTIPVLISGKIDNPSIRPDLKSVYKQLKVLWKNKTKEKLNKEKKKIEKKYKDKLRNKLDKKKDKLKKFF